MGQYPIIFVRAEGLPVPRELLETKKSSLAFFDQSYFSTPAGYNRLLLTTQFYEKFLDYDYILIYHLDALLFRDELTMWCGQGYDYIGAPWRDDDVHRHVASRASLARRFLAKCGITGATSRRKRRPKPQACEVMYVCG